MFADQKIDLTCLVHLLAGDVQAVFGVEGLGRLDDLPGHGIDRGRRFALCRLDQRVKVEILGDSRSGDKTGGNRRQ